MGQTLHILTRPDDSLPKSILAAQAALPEQQLTVIDLTVETPDYGQLLEAIFEADSVQVW